MKINKFLVLALTAVSMSFTACMEETEPTTMATAEQVQASPSAAEGLLMAMPAYANEIWMTGYDNNWHNCFGMAAMMHIRDVMTEDMHISDPSYAGHFNRWARNTSQGDSYIFGQFIWNYYSAYVMTANNMISNVDIEHATEEQKIYYGIGKAFRAWLYLDLARMYEYLPTAKTSSKSETGVDLTNLTVPFVSEKTSAADARNNPRVKRDSMRIYIENDLNDAEKYLKDKSFSTANKTLPDLAVVYGLKARLYMWVEDYDKAYDYASAAITESKLVPMSEEEMLNPSTGMNVVDPWMWGSTTTAESDVVQTGIINWASWMSNQTTFGYTGPSTCMYQVIDKNLYDRINDNDIRKAWFKAPEDRPDLGAKNRYLMPEQATFDESSDYYTPAYTSLKFRPGSGNAEDYVTGSSCSYPLMRVEEMYFIMAEAKAHSKATDGLDILKSFMNTYRCPNYNPKISTQEEIIDEIVAQKRIELWGEGQTFFDVKRLNMSVTRGYPGTNCADALERLNTNGRPAWMNMVIVKNEGQNNEALVGMNNPDPTGVEDLWVE